MTRRPTWPELLSLFEELRFQIAVVAVVLGAGAFAIALTFPKPGATPFAPAPVAHQPRGGVRVAGPEERTSNATTGTASNPAAAPTASSPASPDLGAPVPRATGRPSTPGVGERARLVAPVPLRLTCSDEEAPLGVLLGGADVQVIEIGTSACAGWLLVQSTKGLTWLHPSALVALDATTSSAAGVASP